MSEEIKKIKDFIEKLPLAALEKQRLLADLNGPEGLVKVKNDLAKLFDNVLNRVKSAFDVRRNVAKQAYEKTKEEYEKLEEDLAKELNEIEDQADDIAKAIAQEADKQALEEARKKVA